MACLEFVYSARKCCFLPWFLNNKLQAGSILSFFFLWNNLSYGINSILTCCLRKQCTAAKNNCSTSYTLRPCLCCPWSFCRLSLACEYPWQKSDLSEVKRKTLTDLPKIWSSPSVPTLGITWRSTWFSSWAFMTFGSVKRVKTQCGILEKHEMHKYLTIDIQ